MAENRTYDVGMASFFVEKLCQEADLVYRLGFTLTLSRDGASHLTSLAYKSLVPSLPSLLHKSDLELRRKLIDACWEAFQNDRRNFDVEPSKIGKYLSSLTTEARVAMFLVDIAGFGAQECAEIMGTTELEVRKHLGSSRRSLMTFTENIVQVSAANAD